MQGAGFRVQGAGCRAQGAGCRVQKYHMETARRGAGRQGLGLFQRVFGRCRLQVVDIHGRGEEVSREPAKEHCQRAVCHLFYGLWFRVEG